MGNSDQSRNAKNSFSYNKLYIKILVGVFVVLTICSGFSALFFIGGGTGQGSAFLSGRNCDIYLSQSEYGSYIVDNNRLIRLTPHQTLYGVDSKNSENKVSVLDFNAEDDLSVVYDGNYYFSHGFKYRMTGSVTATETEWVSDDVINEAFPGRKDFWKNAVCFEEYGDNIFFLSSAENNRLCRISKDGTDADYVGKIYTSSYIIIDNYLYYFDNGEVSKKEAGIYKSDIEGEEATLITEKLTPGSKAIQGSARSNLIDKLYFKQGYIYFIDYSKKGDGHVCRIRPDGSDYKKVSPDRAYTFTLDDNETLYYASGSFGKLSGKIYSHKIGEDSQEFLFTEKDEEYLNHRPAWQKSPNLGYIYLKSTDPEQWVKRFDLKKKEYEVLTKNRAEKTYTWKTLSN